MIEVIDLVKNYEKNNLVTQVLKGVSFKIKEGEFVAIMGRSGAGKSTCMYQMSLLDMPTSGSIVFNGIKTESMTEEERTHFRLNNLGYVFQDYALVPELSALENVMVPLLMRGLSEESAKKKSHAMLEKVGLAHRIVNLPNEMSGGEQQRVSVARALAGNPSVLFADEPTANLDNASSESVMDLFKELHENGQTIIMVTHEPEYAEYASRVISMDDGIIKKDTHK